MLILDDTHLYTTIYKFPQKIGCWLGGPMGFLRKKKQRTFEEEQLSKGLIKSGDEWITPAEKFRRERTVPSMSIVREKETITIKEIVKIRCQYCGTTYNIAESDRCPHCGGK
jgi:rubrerythrin